jgi:ribosomal protein L29
MKIRDIQELKNKPLGDLQKLLEEDRTKLQELKFDLAAGKVKDVAGIRELKKKIARIMTFINQSENPKKN